MAKSMAKANFQIYRHHPHPHPHRHPHLPEDVVEAILIGLPVKSLVRFRCVSKSWCLLIKSSTFIYKHLITNKDESFIAMCFMAQLIDKLWLAVCPYEYGSARGVNVCDTQNHAALHPLSMSTLGFWSPNFVLKLVGECNGILCFTYFTTFYLVNPSLKQVKMLYLGKITDSLKFAGFGFDSMTMDFKVIRILNSEDWGIVLQQRAEVYSFKSNAWRVVYEFPLVIEYSTKRSTFFDGVVYWVVRSKVFGWRILTFNTATELFNEMEFPQDWDIRQSYTWEENVPSLFVLHQESLAFVSCCHPLSSSRFVSVWTLSKNEKEEAWTKFYSIGPLPEFLELISFSKKYKLLYKTTTGKLVLYDILNHHSSVVCEDLSQIQPYDAHWSHLRLEIGECRSSLVSINT